MSVVKHFDIDGQIIDIPIPTPTTVNDGILTIQKNGTDIATFTANQSGDTTANITVPTVNNGTLTIQKNGTNVQTFTANQSSNATANITVPTKVSELTNDSGYTTNTGTVTQVKVGSTAYNPSSGVVSLPAYPTVPTVNNGTLTIQKNGTNVQTFTANQSSNATANITVPTKVSELTNDSGYTTNTGTVTQVKVGSTAYNPSSGVVSLPAYPTVPTVNNGTLTIQKNGTNVATFTANQSGNATANITVPTKVSQLTQDNAWVKLGTASTSTPATFANIANAGYHDMMIVVRLNAGADFRFSEIFSVNTFDNGAILTRLGYLTNPTTDFNWVQVSLGATSISIGAVWSAFTVNSCYADLYVKK